LKGLPAIVLAQARQAGDISQKIPPCSAVAKYLGFTPQNICAFGYVLLNAKYLATSLEANRYRLEEIGITS